MNRPILRLYGFVALLFALLVAFTSRWTIFEASSLRENPLNARTLLEQERIDRGPITAANGAVLARSVRGPEGTYQRVYPTRAQFAHAVGYYYTDLGSAGIEKYRDSALNGQSGSNLQRILDQLQGKQQKGEKVVTTLDPAAQQVANSALAGYKGAVVALEPRSGAVTVMASSPSFDPNDLRSPSSYEKLTSDTSGRPLVNRATQFGYAPGSTFKVVTATAAIDTGAFTPESTVSGRNNVLVSGVPLQNDDDESFGQITLTQALAHSVNTVWAQVAEKVGKRTLARYMRRFGFNRKPQLDYPADEMSISGEYLGPVLLPPTSAHVDVGRMGIGQDKLEVTPLQMAEVAAGVGNHGRLMVPHLTARIVDPEGRTVLHVSPRVQSVVMKPSTASDVTSMMEAVVNEGTGVEAQIPGVQVAGKTGTAETQIGTAINNVWFIAFAPAANPTVAIAVTLEGVPGQGAAFAAPVARKVIEQLLKGSPRMIDPETIIDGRYRVISRLGSGGMADVYLAQDQLLGREVAVKVLHHHFAEDQEFVERFRREASSAAALSHPNIVAIFDRGEWNGTYYIAMEYVAGRSLKTIVREHGALDPVAAIDVVVQILRAARFAHRRGVIHRDLKPHNVIIDEEGRARVTDFGIARAGASDMTLTGSIMGTAQYLSPEQAQGFAVSATSDLYSVGVILYELLTGVVPFEGETAVAIAVKQVSAEPRPPSELNPALPYALDAIVLRALAKDPTQRYADADELIAALEYEREALPAMSGATAVVSTEGQPPQPEPPAPYAATGSLLLAPPGGEEQLDPEQGPPASEEERRRRQRRAMLWAAGVAVIVAAIVVALVLSNQSKSVTVPNVTGDTEQAAGAVLRAAGLDPLPSLAPSTTVASGRVISQTPGAGSVVHSGAHVAVVVSRGPASEGLVNVEGLSASKATAKLRAAGFLPTTTPQASSTVASGHVISTNPPAGTEVQVGSHVTVFVSSGPASVGVPDVVGQSQTAAESTLTNAKLAVGTITQQVSSTQTAGTVISQSPATGVSAHEGDKVNLTVAQAPKEVAVPDVRGAAVAAAESALTHAGFTPRAVPRTTTEPSQKGVVLGQSPAGGTQARKGSTVTIEVGELAPQTTTTPTTPTTTTTTTPTTPTPPAATPG